MSASASSSSLESLIHSIIPQSRIDQVLFNDILAHCRDVLSRSATRLFDLTFRLTRQPEICSHIGQSREKDMGHLADIVKRRRTHVNIYPTPLPNVCTCLSYSEPP
jgi:gamma-tubulin complex component 3